MYNDYIKKFLDCLTALLSLIILSPILLIIAFLVRIRLGSPVIFKQERPGLNEKIFEMYKFRTMTNEMDKHGRLLSDEERLNDFGKLLRSSSLDELPELWNILKGDMSFVGPRPLLIQYLPLYNEEQRKRHSIKPGLTGWAQVNGRNAISWNDKFKLDVWYVDNVSFLLDLKIVITTIKKVLSKEGINQAGQATMEDFNGNN